MTRTEVTVGTEGFREYLEFSLGCSMDYREPPLKNGINDRSTIATNLHDLRVLRARISYLRLSTRVNSRSMAVPIRPVQALNAHAYLFSAGHTGPKGSAVWRSPICGPKWPRKHNPRLILHRNGPPSRFAPGPRHRRGKAGRRTYCRQAVPACSWGCRSGRS
jgi:hypothetical protein